ncbi:hypothetical protein ACC791_27955 [Rhizobium ruizarguesonis]
MGKGEREDLQRLIRQREKVLKSAAKQRSTELLADFENQISAMYQFDDDDVWAAAEKAAAVEVEKAQQRVAARCGELGIPKQFAPSLNLYWSARGYHSGVKKRRDELRLAAKAQVAALEQKAVVAIETASVEAQTQVALAGLTSEAARAFMANLPAVDTLMPSLSYQEIAGESDTPVVEQMLTPNALRQRRFRERQKALHNANVTPENTTADSAEDHQEERHRDPQ